MSNSLNQLNQVTGNNKLIHLTFAFGNTVNIWSEMNLKHDTRVCIFIQMDLC